MKYDICIVGGGIIGLSVAMQLQALLPGRSILILEKETEAATHQTGRNSGVIHAGVYYQPGSLKAKFCRIGLERTIAFCREHGLPYEQCGKLIVATDEDELGKLTALIACGRENGLTIEVLDAAELRRREPNITGVGAAFVADSGITNYRRIALKMIDLITAQGGEIRYSTRFRRGVERGDAIAIETDQASFAADYLVVCGGLQADRLAEACGIEVDFRMIPFRGDYFRLAPHLSNLTKHLIYPVPDPKLPFLGVHLTRMIDGSMTVGPNAALSLAREGYGRMSLSGRDLFEMARFPGFWRLLAHHREAAVSELASALSKRVYLERCRKYCPELRAEDLLPYPSGIRAQPVRADGSQIHDFVIKQSARSTHVCNAPSPAATAAFPIGGHVAGIVREALLR